MVFSSLYQINLSVHQKFDDKFKRKFYADRIAAVKYSKWIRLVLFERVRRKMECEISDYFKIVESELVAHQSDFSVYTGDSPPCLHDKRDWIAELQFAKDHENQNTFSNLRSSNKIAVVRVEKYWEKVDNADSELEFSNESICYYFWGTDANSGTIRKFNYTKFQTAPF